MLQGSGVYPFCPFCHAACEEETEMLWLLKTRHGEALLSCIKSFSYISGILQSPGFATAHIDFVRKRLSVADVYCVAI
jgi:hypothetical protein